MSLVQERQFWSDLTKQQLGNSYLLYGEEGFKIDEASRKIEQIFAKKHDHYVRKIYYPDSLNLEDLRQSTQGLTLFQEAQLIFVRGMEQIKADTLAELVAIFQANQSDENVLILTASSIDKRKKVNQQLLKDKKLTVVQMGFANEGEFRNWAKDLAARRKKTLDHESMALLWEYVGPSLFELDLAIEKSAMYAADSKALRVDHIKAVTVKTRQELVFVYTDAISQGDRLAALQRLEALYQQGEEAIAIVALVARQFQWMLQLLSYQESGKTMQDAIADMKLFPKLAKVLHTAAKKRGAEKLRRSLQEIQQADLELKSTITKPKLILERLTVRLTAV